MSGCAPASPPRTCAGSWPTCSEKSEKGAAMWAPLSSPTSSSLSVLKRTSTSGACAWNPPHARGQHLRLPSPNRIGRSDADTVWSNCARSKTRCAKTPKHQTHPLLQPRTCLQSTKPRARLNLTMGPPNSAQRYTEGGQWTNCGTRQPHQKGRPHAGNLTLRAQRSPRRKPGRDMGGRRIRQPDPRL